ncbi:hypothetical protein H7U32_01760 [Bifidobacterium pullorum subsp. saeculare]|uniref:Esterase n=1 Tax=Bifidobacterium pullorum subsp. saeculare TaxID=78257 RepID=A0A938WWV9_9BIFI|nr:alpha/beta hydrolase-fold protein [Bifidobacterium pullorum]MBM6699073.1 hypothetical protein [Bifidobacterium pullorum subsp. saeculare]
MDAYAARHRGLAPVVISPDQLGDATHNTLCADTPVYGNAETYLTRDVPDWIRKALPVDDGAAHWAVAGFSQGGTCSVQLGVRHPDLFGHMMPFASELKPTEGSEATMIRRFFHGDRTAYEAQMPLLAMKTRGHSDQTLMLSSGSLDTSSMDAMLRLGRGARAIGMRVSMIEVPGRAHDWHAVHTAMDAELEVLCRDLGLDGTARPIARHAGIHVLSDGVSDPDTTDTTGTTEGKDSR